MPSITNVFSKTSAILHFVGTYAVAMTLLSFGVDTWWAFLVAAAVGFVWELLDHLNNEYGWEWPGFDPKGADFLDLAYDVAGAGTALLVGLI